jgi:hypothetical protein
MNIFMVYMGIIGPMLSHFDCTNFKVLLVIKIINFNENFKNSPFSYACHLPCDYDYLSKKIIHLTFIASLMKKFNFEIKNFKVVTWYPNMV